MHRYVVAYDITLDARREKVSELLSGYGPRVQLSVFEVELASAVERERLLLRLADLIEPDEDQVRLYTTASDAVIVGSRKLEERASYWVLTASPLGTR